MSKSDLVCGDPEGQPRSPPLFTYGARLPNVGPSRHLHRGSHPGPIRAMWFKLASCIWDSFGQPQSYHMWACGIWDPCGQPQIYPMWGSGIWYPCGKPHIYPRRASGIWDECGLPRSPPLFMYDAPLAQVEPSRHLHSDTQLGPMLVKSCIIP